MRGNLENLQTVEQADNYRFVKADIADAAAMEEVFTEYGITHVIHLAAESHVDRSILNPMEFVRTNVIGTVTLLNIAKQQWGREEGHLFYQCLHRRGVRFFA